MLDKKYVAFFNKGSEKNNIKKWEKKLKKWYSDFELIHLDDQLAKKAKIALVWKPPMEKLLKLPYLNSIICLGQGVDHILNNNEFKKMSVYRIVDPYMAKSMSHWIILSVLNYIRNYDGYRYQQKQLIYKPIKIKDFKKVKIGVYGLGEIGNVVASDLSNLGFKVLGWSRTKKQNEIYNTFFDLTGFNHILKTVDIHICLPLTKETFKIFNSATFSKMKKGVCFINAGRGDHVHENDLLIACQSNIKLAILDVFSEEPLKKHILF